MIKYTLILLYFVSSCVIKNKPIQEIKNPSYSQKIDSDTLTMPPSDDCYSSSKVKITPSIQTISDSISKIHRYDAYCRYFLICKMIEGENIVKKDTLGVYCASESILAKQFLMDYVKIEVIEYPVVKCNETPYFTFHLKFDIND